MSRTIRNGDRHISARGVPNDTLDLRRLARVLIDLAQAQAEAEAQAFAEADSRRTSRTKRPTKPNSTNKKQTNKHQTNTSPGPAADTEELA